MRHGKKELSMAHTQGKKLSIDTAEEVQMLELADTDFKRSIFKMFKELKKKKSCLKNERKT